MPAPPCEPNCQCGKHFRTELHNELISRGMRKAWQENRRQRKVTKEMMGRAREAWSNGN